MLLYYVFEKKKENRCLYLRRSEISLHLTECSQSSHITLASASYNQAREGFRTGGTFPMVRKYIFPATETAKRSQDKKQERKRDQFTLLSF